MSVRVSIKITTPVFTTESVPLNYTGRYLVGVDSNWNPEGPGQPEIRNLDATSLVNQQVLGLQVSKMIYQNISLSSRVGDPYVLLCF